MTTKCNQDQITPFRIAARQLNLLFDVTLVRLKPLLCRVIVQQQYLTSLKTHLRQLFLQCLHVGSAVLQILRVRIIIHTNQDRPLLRSSLRIDILSGGFSQTCERNGKEAKAKQETSKHPSFQFHTLSPPRLTFIFLDHFQDAQYLNRFPVHLQIDPDIF